MNSKGFQNEIRVICRNELSKVDDATLAKSITDIRNLLGAISSNISLNTDFYSYEFIREEPILCSDKFGISGMPDRILKKKRKHVPFHDPDRKYAR